MIFHKNADIIYYSKDLGGCFMLIQFSVENFLSIKDNVVLSLLASKDNEHPEHLIVDGNKKHLKSAVIYGANASGKSNVLNAFWFM